MELLDPLNPQQKRAVTTDPGPVLVLAGPGSGKTRVLTHRAAYLIGELGVQPYHVMAVTFTNKAAEEMRERVAELLGRKIHGLTLGTFHATCARILRAEADHLPVDANYVIYDADDQKRVVKRVIRDLDLDDKRYRPASVHAQISAGKNELFLPEEYPISTYRDEVIARIYQEYHNTLLTSNAMDFDDLLLWMAVLLSDVPEIREKYARRFQHILVDEFQDTNMAQYTLLNHLASFHQNIFVVGDSDQSIYRWRGADYRNVMRFESDYPEAEVILLERNYRSTQTILDVAMAVIDRNPNRTRKSLFTDRGEGRRVIVQELYDDREQAEYVVQTIANLVSTKKASLGDFAIMYRTNAQSRLLEEAFLSANIPYKLVGAQRFYGRREVKDIIAYLRLITNPDDIVSLSRIISTPPRGIGTKTYASLRTQAQRLDITPGQLLLRLADPEAEVHERFSNRADRVLTAFGSRLKAWHQESKSLPPVEIIDRVLDDVDYRTYIEDGTDEGKDRWENVMELRRLASEYQTVGLIQFLEDITLISDQDTIEDDVQAPTLLTLHAAKGLEFKRVFIVGLNDGVLPHKRSFEDPEEMQEERRLFYVGITRTEDQLYLSHALNQYTYGYMEPSEPSRYYRDIPPDLREEGGQQRLGEFQTVQRHDQASWRQTSRKEQPKVEKKHHPGQKVDHPQWGSGMVLNSKIQDDDEVVDVYFDEVGLKKLIASLANLSLLD